MGRLHFSLTTKIFAGLVVVLCIFVVVQLRSVYQLRLIGHHLRLIKRSYLPLSKLTSLLDSLQQNRKLDLSQLMKADVSRLSAPLLKRLRVPAIFLRRLQSSRRILRHLSEQKLETNPQFLAQLHRSLQQITERLGISQRTIVAIQRLGTVRDSAFDRKRIVSLRSTFYRNERVLQREIGSLAIKMDFRLTQVVLQAERSEQHSVFTLYMLLAFSLFVGLFVLFLSRIPLRRIQTLAKATQRIGQGDYQGRVEVKSRDELGVLADEFNRMTDAVRERENHLAQKSRELQLAYRDLQDSSERLRRSERLAAIGQLAAQITHEVRNPLNAIGLNLELLEEDLEQLPNAAEALSVLQASMDEVERLTLITEEYLRYASLPRPKLEACNINSLLSDMMEFLQGELAEKSVSWELSLEEDVPRVNIDERQLRQALLNLLRNAMQAATLTKAEKGALSLSTEAVSGGVAIDIRDNGLGIPEEQRDKIFDPFFSTKEDGSGLGLPLTKQIIEGHGGEIVCRSVPSGGTSFRLYLPT